MIQDGVLQERSLHAKKGACDRDAAKLVCTREREIEGWQLSIIHQISLQPVPGADFLA